ncbi:MAG: lysophospholipid acyltransferase family protein [Bacteroidota bacterium]
MKTVGLAHFFLTLAGKLPFWFWYRMSDLLFLVIFYLVGYRKKVVQQNLRNSFPQKSETEIDSLQKSFYRHFCDLLMESFKAYSMSDQMFLDRVEVIDNDLVKEIEAFGKGCLLMGTHYGNNEWLYARLDMVLGDRIPSFGVYTPFKNQTIEALMQKMRSKRGMQLIPMRRAMIQILRNLQKVGLIGIINDQSPHGGGQLYFAPFLQQPTAYHTSLSKLALRMACPIFFAKMERVRRGYYRITMEKISVDSFLPENQVNIHALTDHLAAKLEAVIEAEPTFWLWTHRRWKHKPRPGDHLSPSLQKDLP